MRADAIRTSGVALVLASALAAGRRVDVAVFGATPAGVTSAVAAARAGRRVLLLEQGRRSVAW